MQPIIETIYSQIGTVIRGKREVVEQVMIALLSEGHILLEDVPGVGKTQLVVALSKVLGGDYKRIQFTPEVTPSDITGFSMYNQKTGEFEYRAGTSMCHFLLADEINRASSRTQSSLLEIMEEGRVTVDGITHDLPKPFIVLATQNPIENYGTYHLPEAQMDRFFIKLSMGYPNRQSEKDILNLYAAHNPVHELEAVLSMERLQQLQQDVKMIHVEESLKEYILDLVDATRVSRYLTLGVSPRGSISLMKASKAKAYVEGRSYVLPDDIQALAVPVLAHRLMLSQDAKSENLSAEDVLKAIIHQTPVR